MDPREIAERLEEPFQVNELKFKPQSVKGNRALAVAYVDCRVIQDRLDEVVGVGNWMDDYEILSEGSVVCRLKLKIGGEWVTKTDVGSPSEQPDGGDRLKAAFSDALKRAAIKFGVGRYIYRLPHAWVDYDPQTRKMAHPPLPAWAQPKRKGNAPAPAAQQTQKTAPAAPQTQQQSPAKAEPTKADAKPQPRQVSDKEMDGLIARYDITWNLVTTYLNLKMGKRWRDGNEIPQDVLNRFFTWLETQPVGPDPLK